MTTHPLLKTLDVECEPENFSALWEEFKSSGAAGAVTSRGSGIGGKAFLRVFWENDCPPGSLPEAAETLCEEDWTEEWKKTFHRIDSVPGFAVVPEWEEVAGAGEKIVLRIDPGMAFGGGDHPTTRLCLGILKDLAERNLLPDEILDVGAGTGILSVAAAKLGARRAFALDIDPFCRRSAERNAKRNGVEERVFPLLLSLDLLSGNFPLVMANIVSGQLETLAGEIKAHAREDGLILFSGFGEDKIPLVERGYAPFRTVAEAVEEGWAALLMAGEKRTLPALRNEGHTVLSVR